MINTKVINSNISSNSNTNNNLKLDANNQIVVQYNSKLNDNPIAYLQTLKTNNNQKNILLNPIDELNQHWDETNRALSGVGQAVIAVAVVVVTCFTTACTAAPATITTAAGTAIATTATTTATISATNASMNTDSSLLGSAGHIGSTTIKDTTSEQSLKNIAIAGATAGITMGITSGINYLTNGSTVISTFAGQTTSFTTKLVNNLQSATINTISSSVAQSAINGYSFTDSLKNSAKNILINAAGELAANQIGTLAHNGDINTTTQLTLHAGLGCGMGQLQSKNCLAGAAGAVTGELVGSSLRDNVQNGTLNKETAVQLSGLAGAGAALFTGVATGQSDAKTASGIWAGYNEGGNAARENALTDKIANIIKPGSGDKANKAVKDFKDTTLNKVADQYVNSSDPFEKAGLALMLGVGSVTLPESITDIEIGIAGGAITKAYAPQIGAGLNKVDGWFGGLWGKSDNVVEAKGSLNLFKWGEPQTNVSSGWKEGDYMLNLTNKGSPKLNWEANYGALRQEMGLGNPIYDSYRLPNGNLIPTNGFLNAERFTLQSRGWNYVPSQGAWLPPIK